ncbi:MAG: class I SAM-dependent methyltransferase [Rubinisphaera brasiliensis]|uniref:class I SAM-dependent methyltransferase n=1 Tax=Rubinisphaera brasiliensis TaxID=119 RepID=UPI00391D572B
MRPDFFFCYALLTALLVGGCSQSEDSLVTDATHNPPASADQAGSHHAHPHGHDHRHAFADPEKLAQKWNASERDVWQRPEDITAVLALETGMSVADIGAGTGYMLPRLSKAVGASGIVVAIDAEPAMVKYLTAHQQEFGPATLVIRQVQPGDPGLEPTSVDRVMTLDVWHHMQERVAYAEKVYAGLKQGGRFVVADYDVAAEVGPPPEMRLEAEQVKQQLEAAGFRGEIAAESMPRHYLVIGHKD